MNGPRLVDAIADSVADAQATALHCVGVELASTDPDRSSLTDARNASPSREIVDPDGYRVVLL
jgi:hypothetical protein